MHENLIGVSLIVSPMFNSNRMKPIFVFAFCLTLQVSAFAENRCLSDRNTEVPFCYLVDGVRSWPFLEQSLPDGSSISFAAKNDDKLLAEGEQLEFSGFKDSI